MRLFRNASRSASSRTCFMLVATMFIVGEANAQSSSREYYPDGLPPVIDILDGQISVGDAPSIVQQSLHVRRSQSFPAPGNYAPVRSSSEVRAPVRSSTNVRAPVRSLNEVMAPVRSSANVSAPVRSSTQVLSPPEPVKTKVRVVPPSASMTPTIESPIIEMPIIESPIGTASGFDGTLAPSLVGAPVSPLGGAVDATLGGAILPFEAVQNFEMMPAIELPASETFVTGDFFTTDSNVVGSTVVGPAVVGPVIGQGEPVFEFANPLQPAAQSGRYPTARLTGFFHADALWYEDCLLYTSDAADE